LRAEDAPAHKTGEDAKQIAGFGFPGPAPIENVAAAIEAWQESWENAGQVRNFGIWNTSGVLMGNVELRQVDAQRVDVSYLVFPDFRRQGIATQAARLALTCAASDLDTKTATNKMLATNEASIVVARALGAQQVGDEQNDADGRCSSLRLRCDHHRSARELLRDQVVLAHERVIGQPEWVRTAYSRASSNSTMNVVARCAIGIVSATLAVGCASHPTRHVSPPTSVTGAQIGSTASPGICDVGQAIIGTLQMVGGTATAKANAVPGTVTATSDPTTDTSCVARAGTDGKFALSLLSGTWELLGSSPNFDAGSVACHGERVVVVPDRPLTSPPAPMVVNVDCQRK
jgi:RimJ/RimL family protein N-acetyltransferase